MLWGEVQLLNMPEYVPTSEPRSKAPSGVAKKPGDFGDDERYEDVGEETDEDELRKEDEQRIIETLTEL